MAEGWSVLDDGRLLSGREVHALLSERVNQCQLATYLQSDADRLLALCRMAPEQWSC
ncbi:hypothetical protein [Serinicoccus sp. CNJ-927]|uniref:hypothetical protein n=1 Tax=Serinicoccus sp. CNJ-927 TaxID=1904970 RepID=UPI0013011D5C|nr:hypothetical protein [Serinicoccus sp. CNJ-927]